MTTNQPSTSAPTPPTSLEEKAKQHRRTVDLLADDTHRACAPNLFRTFTNLEDAIERLLPYHVFGAADGDEEDLQEAAECSGRGLAVSRRDAWEGVCLRRVEEVVAAAEEIRTRVQQLEESMGASWQQVLPEERALLERLLMEDARDALEAEKKRPPDSLLAAIVQQSMAAGGGLGTALGSAASSAGMMQQHQQQHYHHLPPASALLGVVGGGGHQTLQQAPGAAAGAVQRAPSGVPPPMGGTGS